MPYREYPEQNSLEFTAEFEDERRQPASPSTAHWRLLCEHCGTTLVDWTAATVDGTSAFIRLGKSQTGLCDRRNERELKSLEVAANNAQEYDRGSQEYKFWLKRSGTA